MKTLHPVFLLLPLLASILLLTGCDRTASDGSRPVSNTNTYDAAARAEWEAQQKRVRKQMEDYDRQTKRIDDQHDIAEKQMAKIISLQDKQEVQVNRLDKLLDKWEEQAKRKDAILDKMEEEHGIKK